MLLVIDAGTTSFKAVLFDRQLKLLSVAIKEYPVHTPSLGRSELDARSYYQALTASIAEAARKLRVSSADVEAVAVCSHTDTLFPIDDRGNVVRNPILWVDGRASAEARDIN